MKHLKPIASYSKAKVVGERGGEKASIRDIRFSCSRMNIDRIFHQVKARYQYDPRGNKTPVRVPYQYHRCTQLN